MRTLKLEAMRAEIAREILNEEDDALLAKVIAYIRQTKKEFEALTSSEIILGLPRTVEELKEDVRAAEEDIRAGRVYTMEEVFKPYGL
jgi:hypothetical protein